MRFVTCVRVAVHWATLLGPTHEDYMAPALHNTEHTVQYFAVLYCKAQYCTVQHYTTQYTHGLAPTTHTPANKLGQFGTELSVVATRLVSTVLYCTVRYCTLMYCTLQYCCDALITTTQCYTALDTILCRLLQWRKPE